MVKKHFLGIELSYNPSWALNSDNSALGEQICTKIYTALCYHQLGIVRKFQLDRSSYTGLIVWESQQKNFENKYLTWLKIAFLVFWDPKTDFLIPPPLTLHWSIDCNSPVLCENRNEFFGVVREYNAVQELKPPNYISLAPTKYTYQISTS